MLAVMPRPSPLHSCTSSSRSRVKDKVRLEAGVEGGEVFVGGHLIVLLSFILIKKQSERTDRKKAELRTIQFNILIISR